MKIMSDYAIQFTLQYRISLNNRSGAYSTRARNFANFKKKIKNQLHRCIGTLLSLVET